MSQSEIDREPPAYSANHMAQDCGENGNKGKCANKEQVKGIYTYM